MTADKPVPEISPEARALIAELRKGDYTLRRSPKEMAVFDTSWEVRIQVALTAAREAGAREERERWYVNLYDLADRIKKGL